MQLIERMEGIPLEQQRLIYSSKYLEPLRALSDYDVKNGAILHCVLRLSGS